MGPYIRKTDSRLGQRHTNGPKDGSRPVLYDLFDFLVFVLPPIPLLLLYIIISICSLFIFIYLFIIFIVQKGWT